MKLLDLTLSSPQDNLACDEALLDDLESGEGEEVLRFWESETYFVVLGSSNKLHEEVKVEACASANVPILRRHSGGGTVVQGPGCLNYTLVLRIDPNGSTRNITETTQFIMHRHADALSLLLHEKVDVKGSSDLVIRNRKFSGNAQRRRLKALLFHGTFLCGFDISRIEEYLAMPPKQPDYRAQRGHVDFVTNIKVPQPEIKRILRRVWDADELVVDIPRQRIKELVSEKYGRDEWNLKL